MKKTPSANKAAIKLGVIMDPIESIYYHKDSTLAMLWEAANRHWSITYIQPSHLFFRGGKPYALANELQVFQDPAHWYELGPQKEMSLTELNVILMRKDPPFNLEYIYATYILEKAEEAGVLVLNKPQSLRDANEKMFTLHFPECCPETLVTRNISLLRDFYERHEDIVCKPLDGMAGSSVFRLTKPEINASVIFEMLTKLGTQTIMAQKYIPDIVKGDKRILLIEGEPVPLALARIPRQNELRGNLAAGAKGVVQPLTERDYWICKQVGPKLREKKLLFVGLDVIGDFLTEINVTSPTGIREIDAQGQLNCSALFFDAIQRYLIFS